MVLILLPPFLRLIILSHNQLVAMRKFQKIKRDPYVKTIKKKELKKLKGGANETIINPDDFDV